MSLMSHSPRLGEPRKCLVSQCEQYALSCDGIDVPRDGVRSREMLEGRWRLTAPDEDAIIALPFLGMKSSISEGTAGVSTTSCSGAVSSHFLGVRNLSNMT